METIYDWLRDASRGMSPDAVLAQPVVQLQGVSDAAAVALAEAGIHSILDLAASALFAVARQVAEAADNSGPLSGLAAVPSDLLDDAARPASAAAVARMGLSVLRLLEPPLAARLEQALPAPTVRDLALWPPARAARRILQVAYGVADAAEDAEAPSELRPRMGRLPVERVQYQQLLFESVLRKGMPLPMTLNEDAAYDGVQGVEWPLDLSEALLGEGFQEPGLGFRITLAQSWTSVGLALGHLLHSLALAPGEATRVAVVDWTRRVSASSAEDIAENEQLSNSLARNRSVSEVADVVASEMQRGDSRFNLTGAGWGIGAGLAGFYKDAEKGASAAVNFGYSRNDAQGSSFASSQGQRDIGARLAQFAQDRTEQAASLARGRRASVITEVSVQEAERLSTRVVANYNHMHALSVLYFEVVQIYRTLIELVEVEPLLYLPVRPFDFGKKALVERYRGVLAEIALNAQARDALLGIVKPPPPAAEALSQSGVANLIFTDARPVDSPEQQGRALDAGALRSALGTNAQWANPELSAHSDEAALVEVQCGSYYNTQGQPLGPALSVLILNGTAGSENFAFKSWAQPADLRYALSSGQSRTPYRVELAGPASRLDRMRSILLRVTPNAGDTNCELVLVFKRLDARGRPTGDGVNLRALLTLKADSTGAELLSAKFKPDAPAAPIAPPAPPFDLIAHLKANALHYTMGLLRRADPALLGLLLGRLQVGGALLLGQVDPVPIAHVGNYLVFRWLALRQAKWWTALLQERGLAPNEWFKHRREALVPMPTGGVFAEAVQGRFNAAEKLDLTRFWNWQDSPIPLTPSEIAPLQAGQRHGADAPQASSLGQATLRQQDAPALPDPSGTFAKALEIAGKGDAFRDMSGLNTLLAEGGKAMTLAAQGAREFMAKAMETVSAYGARVNQGKKMDDEAKAEAEKQAANDKKGGGANTGGPGGAPGSGGPGTAPGGNPPVGSSPGSAPPAAKPAAPRNQENAFGGPQAGAATAESDAPRTPMGQRYVVSAMRSAGGDKVQGVQLDGELRLTGLPSVQSRDGEVVVSLQGGVGDGAATRTDIDMRPVSARLDVWALDDAQLDVSSFTQIPGTPQGWLNDMLFDMMTLSGINSVPVVGVTLPRMNTRGEQEVALELMLEVVPLVRVMREVAAVSGEPAAKSIVEPVDIDLTRWLASTPVSEQNRMAIQREANARLVRVREYVARLLRQLPDEVALEPVVSVAADFDLTSKVLTLAPRWVFVRNARLRLRT